MEKLILFWLDIWLYVILAIGVLDVVLMLVNRKNYNAVQKLSVCAAFTLVLHAWEEWILPGGFGFIYNEGSLVYPMNRLTDMITIFSGVLIISCINFYWAYMAQKNQSPNGSIVTRTGICVFLISAIEVFMHFTGGFRHFETYGFYNPGLATALALFLPIAILFIMVFKKIKPSKKDWLIGIAATVVIFITTIILPEEIFKDPNTPYGFKDAGWYQQFLE